MSQYDPYSPREVEEPQVGYTPIKQPTTPRDVLAQALGPDRGDRLPLLEAEVPLRWRSSSSSSSRSPARCSSRSAPTALLWGWKFAVGFVLLLFVHELGHVIEAKRQGLPGLGAALHPVPRRADHAEAAARRRLGRGEGRDRRPDRGRARLGARLVRRRGGDSELLVALGFTGFFLNLFNLAPISPLDGGRIVAAIHPGALVRRARRARRARVRRAESDPDPDPRPRRARVVAALEEPEQPRVGDVLPGQPASAG